MLLSVMLLVTLMMLALAVEAPRIAQEIKRQREEELIHRGNEYKNAITRYYRKFGQLPVSVDQLLNTNNIHFLRKKYKDPITGKDDWRLLHMGEVQINAVNGALTTSPGGPQAGQIQQFGQSSQFGQASGFGQTSQAGQSSQFGQTSQFGQSQFGQSQFGQSQFGQPANPPAPAAGAAAPSPSPGAPAGTDPNAPGGTQGASTAGMTSASTMTGGLSNSPVIGGGPIIGVASVSKLKSIKVMKGKDHYNDWPFVFDLAAGVPGGQMGVNPAGGVPGQAPGQAPGVNGPPGMAPIRPSN